MYEHSVGGALKLKGTKSAGIKKKKQKKDLENSVARELKDQQNASLPVRKLTPAEEKFAERQKQRELERIMKKASKSHREKVEELNAYLERQTEHFDIPKVSWTK
eukprot:Sdes_comp9627_c0_seq1m1107